MYRIPKDIDIKSIIGCDLNLLGLGRYGVQLNFDGSGIKFSIQVNVSLLENEKVIANCNEKSNWSSLDFQKVLNATVEGYAVPNENLLEIRFDKGLTLQLHDESDQYKAMQIYFDDRSKPTIII